MNEFKEIPASKKSIAFRKPICGIGTNDADYITQPVINGKQMRCPYYVAWASMLGRCYSAKYQASHPTYAGCSVVKEWLTFSNFKKWMKHQDWRGKQLDKDILIVGNKVYSPDTCIFVSSAVNKLLIDSAAKRGDYPQGVAWDKIMGKYRSYCNVNGKLKHLGYFGRANEAEVAYLEFKITHVTKIANDQPLNIKNGLLNHVKIFRNLANNINDIKGSDG